MVAKIVQLLSHKNMNTKPKNKQDKSKVQNKWQSCKFLVKSFGIFSLKLSFYEQNGKHTEEYCSQEHTELHPWDTDIPNSNTEVYCV